MIRDETRPRLIEHEGLGTTIIINVDKQRDFLGQRQQVLSALERVMSSGDEDFIVGYYDRPVVTRLKGVVERFKDAGKQAHHARSHRGLTELSGNLLKATD